MTRAKSVALGVVAVAALALFSAPSSGKPDAARYECTRISVPESINFTLRTADGKRVSPPLEKSPAFQELLTTVELPAGFSPVGGGGEFVVACRPVN